MKHWDRGLTVGISAGLAGGIAEVAWIWTYAAVTHADAGVVARAVSDTVGLSAQGLSPVAAGVGIHMSLAAILGMAVAFALRPARGRMHGFGLFAAVTSALALVWAVNFMVVLPLVNPAFVSIVPLGVSFISKLLFGVAAASTLLLAQPATLRLAAHR